MRATAGGGDVTAEVEARALAARIGGIALPPAHVDGWWSRSASEYAQRVQELTGRLTDLGEALDVLAGRLAAGR